MDIPELKVSYGKSCSKLCEAGCSDYGNRPKVCKDFSCIWKSNFVEDYLMPERCGAVAKWHTDGSIVVLPINGKDVDASGWKRFARKAKVKMQVINRHG